MNTKSITLAGIIVIYSLQQYGLSIDGCHMKYITNETSGYRCNPYYGSDVGPWQMKLPQCVWKCLSISACHYINHKKGTDNCFIGLGACLSLEPAPGFFYEAFEPSNYSCLTWGSHDEPGRQRVQMHDGLEMLYASRVAQNGNLIPGKYTTIGTGFWCSVEGERNGPWSLEDIQVLTMDSTCQLTWIHYTSGEQLPLGAVIGGHLADNTILYVARLDDGNHQPAYGYYNPRSGIAHYEVNGAKTATTMYLLILQ